MPLPPLTAPDSARAKATYDRWAADRRESHRLRVLLREIDAIDQWYQTHDGIRVNVMRRNLADHALEQMDALALTIATMIADDKGDAAIAGEAVRVVSEFVAHQREAQDKF